MVRLTNKKLQAWNMHQLVKLLNQFFWRKRLVGKENTFTFTDASLSRHFSLSHSETRSKGAKYKWKILIQILTRKWKIHRPSLWPGRMSTNASSVTIHSSMQPLSKDICGLIVGRSPTNATSATMLPLMKVLWGHVWKHTVEKNWTNATSVVMHPQMQGIWGYI